MSFEKDVKIASLQPLSLSDFPPYLSAIIFTIGCNLRCSYCHNKDLWNQNHPSINHEKVFAFLEKNKKRLSSVVITGGEPTIYNNLPDFMSNIKKLGYKIKLNTNGIKHKIVGKIIKKKLVDYIALDIKSSLDLYQDHHLENIKKSIELIVKNNIPHEFRTIWNPATSKTKNIEFIKEILPKTSKHILKKAAHQTK